MRNIWVLSVPILMLLAACGDEPAQPPKLAPKPQTEREKAINNTQAASAVGYDGDALKQSVQTMVDGAGQQNQKAAEATAAASGAATAPAEPAK